MQRGLSSHADDGRPAWLPRLPRHRDLYLHSQSPEEADFVRQAGEASRRLRHGAGCSRAQWAERLAVDLEVVLAVENGLGDFATARALLEAGRVATGAGR